MMQTQHLVIQQAEREDVAAILDLYVAAGITGDDAFSVAEAQKQLDVFARYPFHRVFVAKLQGVVVGTYELILIDNLAKAGVKTAIVEDVAVVPTLHKQGVGKAMMIHACAVAKEHGAYKLALSSNKRRQDAHAFYKALGFERHGISFGITL